MSVPEVELPAAVRRAPAPGEEAAGPPLTHLVVDLRRAVDALEALYRRARQEAQVRYVTGRAGGQTDANGDAAIFLFEVPQGATGYLVHCALDEDGVTPANPDTSLNLWHAIYAGSGKDQTRAQVVAVGSLLDCTPQSPGIDTQIPFVYLYGEHYAAPTLVGPQSFYLVIDAATASKQIGVRFGLLIEQPEP